MYRPSLAVSLSVLACALGGYAALKPNPPAQTVIQEAPGTSLDELSAFAQRTARDFEGHLERGRFKPMREYTMALERRIVELEASRGVCPLPAR